LIPRTTDAILKGNRTVLVFWPVKRKERIWQIGLSRDILAMKEK